MDVGAGQPDAGVVDGQHRSMSPAQGGRLDRVGSLFDGACPTAATPDTGLTERLPWWRKRSANPVWTWGRANRTLPLSTVSTGRCPLRREGARTGSARCSTVLARLPQRRIPAWPNGYVVAWWRGGCVVGGGCRQLWGVACLKPRYATHPSRTSTPAKSSPSTAAASSNPRPSQMA